MSTHAEVGDGWSAERELARVGLIDSTATRKRPNRRGELTRDRIVQAAVDCFTEYGYSRTRISDIAHRAGTAQGNFYRHFGSLDEVFLAALAPALDELAHASNRPEHRTSDLEQQIAVSTDYLASYARNRALLRLLREAAAVGTNAGFLALWLNLRQHFISRTERWLGRLDERGALTPGEDLHLLAEALGCMTEQMAYINIGLKVTTPRPEEVERLGRALGSAWHRAVPYAGEGAP